MIEFVILWIRMNIREGSINLLLSTETIKPHGHNLLFFLLFTLQVWRLLKRCRKSIILHFKDKKKKQEVCSAAVMKIIYHFLNWGYSQKTIWKVPRWLVLRSELLPSVHIASSPHRNTSETYMVGADMELNWSALLYCCIAVQWPRPHMSHHRQQQHSQFNSTLSLSTSLNQCLITRMTSSANYFPPPPPHPPTFFSCQLCLWCSACSSSKATTGYFQLWFLSPLSESSFLACY